MDYYTVTDRGRVRKNNEDYFNNISSDKYKLHIVCDGIATELSGEIASMKAVEYISEYVEQNFDIVNSEQLINDAIFYAHNKIYNLSIENEEYKGMGTTVVLALIVGNTLYYGNAGDSRIYKHSNNKLIQITRDHTFAQDMIDSGALTKEEAEFSQYSNQITSALGTDLQYKFDLNKLELENGDTILLATDGLTDMVDDADINEVLNINTGAREVCEILTYIANSSGGLDNITVTCIKV